MSRQSSKVPWMAILCTLRSRTVVICASGMGETRLCGCRINTLTSFFPRRPYIAALPVSPEVAPHHHGEIVPLRSKLALIFSLQKVLKEVPDELERNILECKGGAVEELEEVCLRLAWLLGFRQGNDWGGVGVAEGGVGPLNEGFEVGGDLAGGDVEGENLKGELLEGEVRPGGEPVLGEGGDGLGDKETPVDNEDLEDDFFKGELHVNTGVSCASLQEGWGVEAGGAG